MEKVEKVKTKYFAQIPFRLTLIVDELYERGYIPVIETEEGFQWIYESELFMEKNSIKKLGLSVARYIKGVNGFSKTLDNLGLYGGEDFVKCDIEGDNIFAVRYGYNPLYLSLD